MFRRREYNHGTVQFPTSLRETTLFDAEGNVWRINEKHRKILKLFPETTLTLTKHASTKPFVDSQVQNSIQEAIHLWREKYALPALEKMTPSAHSYLEECIQNTKRLCTKKLLEALGAEGVQRFKEIMEGMLTDVECLVAKKKQLAKETEKLSPQFLPQGTRFHWNLLSGDIHHQIFCIENAPQQRTISIMGETRRLAFPWIYFIAVFSNNYLRNLYAFYRNAPLTELDDTLCFPNFPNINPYDYSCCLGNNRPFISLFDKHWEERLFTYFWGSSFRHDGSAYNALYESAKQRIPGLQDLDTWETLSRANPLFVLTLPWKEHITLHAFIDRLIVDLGITEKINAAQQENQNLKNTITKRYQEDFAQQLAINLHAICSNTSSEIDTTSIVREQLMTLFKELENELVITLEGIHTSISDTLSLSIAQTTALDKGEKHS